MGDMRESLKTAAVAAAVKSGCHRWPLRRHRQRVTILMYHGFYEEGHCDGLEQYGTRWCEISDFQGHLDYLRRFTHVVSLEQLVAHYQNGAPLPPNAVVITIDDGYASNYHLAYPLLKAQGMPACIFLSYRFVEHREFLWPDRIEYSIWKTNRDSLEVVIAKQPLQYSFNNERDKLEAVSSIKQKLKPLSHQDRMTLIGTIEDKTGEALSSHQEVPPLLKALDWNEIHDMTENGHVSIGSHSVRHPNLTTCTDDQLREELVTSKTLIERKTGKECSLFCFPGGAFDDRVKRYVKEAGYHCALAIGGQFERRNHTDLFELKRMGVARSMRLYGFIGRLLY